MQWFPSPGSRVVRMLPILPDFGFIGQPCRQRQHVGQRREVTFQVAVVATRKSEGRNTEPSHQPGQSATKAYVPDPKIVNCHKHTFPDPMHTSQTMRSCEFRGTGKRPNSR
jgi:hypothetical protein